MLIHIPISIALCIFVLVAVAARGGSNFLSYSYHHSQTKLRLCLQGNLLDYYLVVYLHVLVVIVQNGASVNHPSYPLHLQGNTRCKCPHWTSNQKCCVSDLFAGHFNVSQAQKRIKPKNKLWTMPRGTSSWQTLQLLRIWREVHWRKRPDHAWKNSLRWNAP